MSKEKNRKKVNINTGTALSYTALAVVIILFGLLAAYNLKGNNKTSTVSGDSISINSPVNTTDTASPANTSGTDNVTSTPNAESKTSPQVNWKASVNKLETEGYTTEEVNSAVQYVDRVISMLNEIGTFSQNLNIEPEVNTSESADNATGKYVELQSKIDKDKAVYLMVKLKKDFKNIENVFDEYLVSLQLDIDMNEYINDKDSYGKKKSEKLTGKDISELISVEKIEREMLDSIQKQNEKNRVNNSNPDINNPAGSNPLPGISQPDANVPKVDIPMPVDPAEELRKKIGQ